MKELGTVAIVGTPSVGKSTLFNRMIQQRKSIVSEEHGVTRDRLYSKCEWLGNEFMLIDTGGLELKKAPFQTEIKAQVQLALDEADIILFVVDGRVGLSSDDEYVAKQLYKTNKKVLLVVNKVDSIDLKDRAYEFYSLGFGDPIITSAAHGIGVGDLLDEIVKSLPEKKSYDYGKGITFTLVGRPNVGKSSLANAILGEERSIVSPIAGTTRDSIDTPFKRKDKDYVIVDTAGLKKRGKIYEAIDKYAALRAVDAVERSQVVLLVIDASMGIIEQDRHVIELATENNKPVVIVVNKWDLHSHGADDQRKFSIELKSYFKFLDYSPIVYLSAMFKPNLDILFNAIDECYEDFNKRIQTSILNQVIVDAQAMNEAPDFNGGRVKISFVTQVSTCPPTFVLFVNNPKFMHFSYLRYIDNTLRTTFKLEHTPLKLLCRKKGQGEDKL